MARRGKKRRAKVEEAEVPMSSMIDVVFLLLIYFIVTQKPIIEETLLAVDLPSPSSGPPPKEKPVLFSIDVNYQGAKSLTTYALNQQLCSFEWLKKQLMIQGENSPDTTVIINCGANARHKKLIQLLDACAKAGLNKLNLVEDGSSFRPMTFK